jgi:outer membrane protein assembly factor BamA
MNSGSGDYTDLPKAKKLRVVCHQGLILTLVSMLAVATAVRAEEAGQGAASDLNPERLETEQVVIGEIIIDAEDVFDLSDPKENNFLYRLANRLHIITKDPVIEKQLLFKSGQPYSKRLADESERILRANTYFYDVSITPVNRHNGAVDLVVNTRDVWTLKPGFSYSRSGGEDKKSVNLEELNLFGRGQQLEFLRSSDIDRDTTSFEFRDQHFGRSWTSVKLRLADNSDGHSNLLSVIRPFYALDTRWAAGITAFDDDRSSTLYQLGEKAAEYRHERDFASAFGGWSAGLRDGWVRRYTAGVVADDNRFSEVIEGTLPAAIPTDRNLVYPFFGVGFLEDKFEKSTNRDQISKTEDFLTGTHVSASFGWSNDSWGADRDALLYSMSASLSYGELSRTAWLYSADVSGRYESGEARNSVLRFGARYYRQQTEKRMFFAEISTTIGSKLDLDNPVELGGDTGMRGYPLRYQSGNSKVQVSLEQRFFWDWYPFRLFRVGGAVFADYGRTWGANPLGEPSRGWLADVGFGLRFAPTRTGSRKIVHVDIAFPLHGDESIDSVQILIESKRRF